MKVLPLVVFAVLLFSSCEKNEKNYEGFVPITEQSIYDSLNINPVSNYFYYEIRNNYCFDTTRYTIIYSKGINPNLNTKLYMNKGVYYSTGDLCMFNNILTFTGTEYKFLVTYDDILDFLGLVDCKGDALFIVHLNGYDFKYNDKYFGIKEDDGKFQIICCKLVSICAPVQTDKFLLEIDHLGNIKILKQETISKDEHACI
jgi:hypothetical protein